MQTPPDLLTLYTDIIRLVSQTQPTLNTFLFKTLAKKYGAEVRERKKLSDKIRYAVKKLCKANILKINRISARLYEIEVSDGRKALDLIKLADARNQPEKPPKSKQSQQKQDFWQLSAEALSPRYSRQNSIWREAANQYWLKTKLNKDEQEEVNDLFEDWKDDVKQRILILESPLGELEFLEYKSRFTSPAEAMRILKTAEEAFKIALEQYDKAVFLTLTLPPIFPIKLALYALSFLLHRIKAFIRKQKRESAPHFKVLEPQNSFYPHFHVVIFGIDFIMQKRKLTKYLDKHLKNFLSNLGEHYRRTINKRAKREHIEALNKLGKRLLRKYNAYKRKHPKFEGAVNWVTKVKIEQEKAFFENPPPDRGKKTMYDGGQASVWDYIKYYITANLTEVIQESRNEGTIQQNRKRKQTPLSFYWLTRQPFYTISPKIRPSKPKPPPAGYIFKGSIYVWQLEALGFIV